MTDCERAAILAEAEAAIIARLAGYDPKRDGAAIAATYMSALVVKRLRTGETATEIEPSFVVVPREPTKAMHNAARDWSYAKYGKPIGIDASDGCWRAMLAAVEKEEEK